MLRRPAGLPRSDDGDPTTRPPLLVTATVEKIELRGKRINLDEDMEVGDFLCCYDHHDTVTNMDSCR